MKTKMLYVYSICNILFYAILGITLSYNSYYLLSIGYSNTEIANISAIGCLISILIQTVVTNFIDQSKKYNVIHAFEFMSIALCVFLILQLLNIKSIILSISIAFVLAISQAIQPIINSVCFELADKGFKLSYSIPRALGSLSYSLFCSLMGTLLLTKEEIILPIASLILTVLLSITILIVLDMSKHKTSIVNNDANANDTVSFMDFFKNNKYYILANIGTICILFSEAVFTNYMLQIVENIGGNSENMGIVLSMVGIFEMLAMFSYTFIKNKFSGKTALIFSALFFVVKSFLILKAKSISFLYVSQICQFFAFGLFMPTIVDYVDSIMSKKESIRGQALFTNSLTFATVLANFISGRIIDYYSVRFLLLMVLVITFFGFICFAFFINKTKTIDEL